MRCVLDPKTKRQFLLKDLAKAVGGVPAGDPGRVIQEAAPFEKAGSDAITYAESPKFLKNLSATRAGTVIVPENTVCAEKNLICVKHPQVAYTKALALFYPPKIPLSGVSSQACIADTARIGEPAYVGPGVVIGENTLIGNDAAIYPGTIIGEGVEIGDGCRIHPRVVVMDHCKIGDRVVIHPGAVIGGDGFGFASDGEGHHKIVHRGIVQIDDDVEIGSLVTIDRAVFDRTWIQKGVKIDNLVHIGHNVIIGEKTLIVAQVGIAGSTTVGAGCILAGQSGISGHLTIGDHVTIGPRSGVVKSIADGEVVSGTYAMPHRLWLKVQNILPDLPELKKKILRMEKRSS